MWLQLISQIVHPTSSFVTMESVFLIIIGVTSMMTVEISVTNMDVVVCDVRWEEAYSVL